MNDKETIGVAFLGLGRMGETHLRNLMAISGVRVVVVADPQAERAEHGRVMSGAELAMTEPEKAIEQPSVDAVVIVTPTDTHARLIEAAANAGKAVFSEKPIALDLAETQRVVQVVQQRKVPLQLVFMRRISPTVLNPVTACSWKLSLPRYGRAASRLLVRKTLLRRSDWPSLLPGAGAKNGR